MSAAGQIRRFCSVILGGQDGSGDERLSGHMVYVWTLPDRRTRWCPADEPGTIASAVLDAGANQRAGGQGVGAVYIGLGGVPVELARELGWDHRPKAGQVDMVPALWADLDVAGFGHAGTAYPPDVDTVLDILDSTGLRPTIVIDSGYGIQAWWALLEPVVFSEEADPDAAREEVATLSRDWISTLRFHADVKGGWKIDSVFDLSRVMRAPGTWNTKDPETPRPVKILKVDEHARYELDHFRAYLAPQNILDSYASRTTGGPGGPGIKELPGVDLGETWARVNSEYYRARRHVPEWMTILIDAGVGGEKLEHTWEGRRPEFSGDQSSYDAALVRILAHEGVTLEQQVEAVMCRRIRSGEKVDKVDPTRRVDYLLRTFAMVRRSMEEDRRRRDDASRMFASDAAVTVTGPPRVSLPPEPEPVVGGDGDDFADFMERELDAQVPAGVVDLDAARRERTPPPEEEPPPPEEEPPYDDAPPPPDEPPPGPGGGSGGDGGDGGDEPPGDEPPGEDPPAARPPSSSSPPRSAVVSDEADPWGERNEAVVERLDALGALLIPDEYRKRGVRVWRLEHKDYGEDQKGRVVFRLPDDFGWPTGSAPKLYRRGKPLFSEWYRRDAFETPKGFRMALERDAQIPAQQVGNRKEDWQRIVSLLVSYWEHDSSASDLATAAAGWLWDWLMLVPPTVEEHSALDHGRAFLVDHAAWATEGTPVVYLPKGPWLTYVGTQPGGPKGRAAKELLGYVHLIPRRRRLVGGDGVPRRVSWFEVAADQFTHDEWAEMMEKARETMEANKERPMRAVKGGRP